MQRKNREIVTPRLVLDKRMGDKPLALLNIRIERVELHE